jgi:hypothetical protein
MQLRRSMGYILNTGPSNKSKCAANGFQTTISRYVPRPRYRVDGESLMFLPAAGHYPYTRTYPHPSACPITPSLSNHPHPRPANAPPSHALPARRGVPIYLPTQYTAPLPHLQPQLTHPRVSHLISTLHATATAAATDDALHYRPPTGN